MNVDSFITLWVEIADLLFCAQYSMVMKGLHVQVFPTTHPCSLGACF